MPTYRRGRPVRAHAASPNRGKSTKRLRQLRQREGSRLPPVACDPKAAAEPEGAPGMSCATVLQRRVVVVSSRPSVRRPAELRILLSGKRRGNGDGFEHAGLKIGFVKRIV